MHNNYSEAVIGKETLNSQAPSANAQTKCIKRKSLQVKNENLRCKTVQKLKYIENKIYYCGRLVCSRDEMNIL